MRNFILILSFLLSTNAFAIGTPAKIVKADIYEGGANVLLNPGFQAATATQFWTAAKLTGTTFTCAGDTTNYAEGKQSALCTATAATGEFSQDYTPTFQTNGVPMVSACMVKTTGTDVQVCARTNATDITCSTVASNGNWVLQPVNFTGPANGTSVGVSVKNTTSNTETYNVGKCYVGVSSTPQNFGQVSQASLWGTISITCSGGNFSTTSTSSPGVDFTATTGCTKTVTGNIANDGNTTLPTFNMTGGPGHYVFTSKGGFGIQPATTNSAYFTIADTTNSKRSDISSVTGGTQTFIGTISPSLDYTTGFSNASFHFQAYVGAGTAVITNNSPPLYIEVWRYPSASEIAYRPDVLPASWSGTQVGAGGGWSTTNVGGYVDFSAATTSNILTQLTNTNFGTVTAESTKLPGVTFTPPRTGVCYTVSATGTASNSTTSNGTLVRIADGSGNVINGGVGVVNTTGTYNAFSVQGYLNVTSTSPVTVKLQGGVSGASTGSIFQASTNPITWTISAGCQSQNSPLLMGSVTSNSSGQEHMERALVSDGANCTSTPCTITSQSGSWLSSVSRTGTGAYTLNFTAGEFSSAPSCTITTNQFHTLINGSSSTSSLSFLCENSSTVPGDCGSINIHCMGPR